LIHLTIPQTAWYALAVLLLGCGRSDFDSGGAAALVCGHSLAAPASVTVSGHTFTSSYTTTGSLSDVPVAVHAFDDPAVLASSKSDANGVYSLTEVNNSLKGAVPQSPTLGINPEDWYFVK